MDLLITTATSTFNDTVFGHFENISNNIFIPTSNINSFGHIDVSEPERPAQVMTSSLHNTISDSSLLLNMGLKWTNNDTADVVGFNSSSQNETMELPLDMQFNDGHLLSIIGYSILMVFSAIGNLSVLNSIIKMRMKARLSRVNLLLMHLAIADLLVCFILMPLEIGWNITVSWKAGDIMCRVLSFFRTFGLYLSGFIVVCISFDRYFAIMKPLALPEANRRGRVMLYMAWTGSVLCSLPQAWVFHLEHHPVFTWYEQCITVNSFSSVATELAYNFFGFIFMYGFPMGVIIFCYTSILYEIYKINALRKNGEELRRSSMEALTRAKIRTLKMTVLIVTAFIGLWLPYNCMALWYWFDKESAKEVDHRIQKCLFLFACTCSCVNPLIYYSNIRNQHRRKNEVRIRQTLIANNCRLEQIMERPPYGIRIRWQPRDCLCPAASGSSSENSKPQDRIDRIEMTNRGQYGPQSNRNPNHFHRQRRGTQSTAVDTFGSQRQTKTSLVPLSSTQFHRHVPPQQLDKSMSMSKPNIPQVVNNNNLNNSKSTISPPFFKSNSLNGSGIIPKRENMHPHFENSQDCQNADKLSSHGLCDGNETGDHSASKDKNSLQFDLDLEAEEVVNQ